MKNKIFVLLAVAISTVFAAKTVVKSPGDQLIKFHEMEEAHKLDWFGFMRRNNDAKSMLLEQQKKDWVAFRKGQIKSLEGLTDLSQINTHLKSELRSAIALHEKHVAAWEKWATTHHEEAKKLAAKHRDQLEAFKKTLK